MRSILLLLATAGHLTAAHPSGIARPSFENNHALNGDSGVAGLLGYWPAEYVSTADNHLDLGTLPVLTLESDFAWSFWVNADVTDNSNTVFGNRWMADGTDFDPREFIKFTPRAFEWHVDAAGAENVSNDATMFVVGEWAHNLVVKQGASLTYYRNGEVIAAGDLTSTPANAQPLYLGGVPGPDGATLEGFAGTFMEVATFDRALSAADVADVYNRGLNGESLAGSGVISFNSGIVDSSPPSSENNSLKEYSFGQPFLSYDTPYETPSASFADDVLFNGRTVDGVTIDAVYPKLYPTGYENGGVVITNTDLQDPAKGGAFRYRWLMYGPDPNHTDGEDNDGDGDLDTEPAILNLFANQSGDSNQWFTDEDRNTAKEQIGVLRDALALDPLNRVLQSALLDIYYDLSVAEMQLVRRQQVLLGRIRLGLDTPPTFIIDEEIAIYEKMVARTGDVLALYGELLSFRFDDGGNNIDGFVPSDLFSGTIASDMIDPSRGAPFGYFIFQNQVPLRNQIVSQYAPADSNEVVNIIDPGDQNIFQGFKDYRSLLTILGQYIQFQSDLAILRAKRMATTPSGADITLARQGLQDAQEAASVATMLNRMFYQPRRWTGSMDEPVPIDFDDPAFEATGVSAAKEAVITALTSSTNARTFTNGVTNSLGLDPNFLLLVPSQPGLDLYDSYDVLAYKMTEKSGDIPIGPLAVARDLLGDPDDPTTGGGAIQAYSKFRESVDRVSKELADLDDAYAERFVQITGYDYGAERDQWNGIDPNQLYQKPGTDQPSELQSANDAIVSLELQQATLTNVQKSFADNVKAATKAVSIAEGIAPKIFNATSKYFAKSASAYLTMGAAAAAATAAQAGTDGVLTAATLENPLSAGAKLVAITAASAGNAAVQSSSALATVDSERKLDWLALNRDADIQAAGAELTLQESILTLGELQREAESIKLEVESLKASVAQATSERISLLREVERMTSNLKADRKSLATRYYSDPIHFIRSESFILEADAAFSNAQRWTYFTCRALEHKWNQKFKYASPGDAALGVSYDISNVFSARNALELETILQKMAQFNNNRISVETANKDAVISFKTHLLSPNPNDPQRTFQELDDGRRRSSSGTVIDQLAHFREKLRSYTTSPENSAGKVDVTIPFNTSTLETLGGAFLDQGSSFFNGFGQPLTNPAEGIYRNKIVWLAVNIVADDGVTPPSSGNAKGGRLVYAGNTYFRTRIPIRPLDRTPADAKSADDYSTSTDFPSEYIVQPFRYFQDTRFDGQFELFDRQDVGSMVFAYSNDSYNIDSVKTAITSSIVSDAGFRRENLKERSVLATRWELDIKSIDIDQINDIELIIHHVYTQRPEVNP